MPRGRRTGKGYVRLGHATQEQLVSDQMITEVFSRINHRLGSDILGPNLEAIDTAAESACMRLTSRDSSKRTTPLTQRDIESSLSFLLEGQAEIWRREPGKGSGDLDDIAKMINAANPAETPIAVFSYNDGVRGSFPVIVDLKKKEFYVIAPGLVVENFNRELGTRKKYPEGSPILKFKVIAEPAQMPIPFTREVDSRRYVLNIGHAASVVSAIYTSKDNTTAQGIFGCENVGGPGDVSTPEAMKANLRIATLIGITNELERSKQAYWPVNSEMYKEERELQKARALWKEQELRQKAEEDAAREMREQAQLRADRNAELERQEMVRKATEKREEEERKKREEKAKAAPQSVDADFLRDCNIHGLFLKRLELKRAIPQDTVALDRNIALVRDMEARIDIIAKGDQRIKNLIAEAATNIAEHANSTDLIVGVVNKALAQKASMIVDDTVRHDYVAERWVYEIKYVRDLIQSAIGKDLIPPENFVPGSDKLVVFDYDLSGRKIAIDADGSLSIFSSDYSVRSVFSPNMQQIEEGGVSRPVDPQEYYMALLALQNGLAAASEITQETKEHFKGKMVSMEEGEAWGGIFSMEDGESMPVKEFRDGYYKDVDAKEPTIFKVGDGFCRIRMGADGVDGDMIDIVDGYGILHTAVSAFELENFLELHLDEERQEEEEEELDEEEEEEVLIDESADAAARRALADQYGDINDITGFMKAPYSSQYSGRLMVNKGIITESMTPEVRAANLPAESDYFRITPLFLSVAFTEGQKLYGNNFLRNAEFAGLYLDELLRPEGAFFDTRFPPVGATFRNCVLSINFANFTQETLKSFTFQDCKFTPESLLTIPEDFKFDAMQFREAVRDEEGNVIPRSSPIFSERAPRGVPCEPFPDDTIYPISSKAFAFENMLRQNNPTVKSR